jgi:hypothetical protein
LQHRAVDGAEGKVEGAFKHPPTVQGRECCARLRKVVATNSLASAAGLVVAFETTTNIPALLSPLANLVGPGLVSLA